MAQNECIKHRTATQTVLADVSVDEYETVLRRSRLRLVSFDAGGALIQESAPADAPSVWPEANRGAFQVPGFRLATAGTLGIELLAGTSRYKASCGVEPVAGPVMFLVVRPLIGQGSRVERVTTASSLRNDVTTITEPTEVLFGITAAQSSTYPRTSGG